jgi:5,10-methylenetetrahydromethanopterin reductase
VAPVELGIWLPAALGADADTAARAEREGFDVALFGDGQNLYPDPYVRMGLAAGATSAIRLATSVTNPVTRHPAVTAAGIATVQAESGGRAILGIGRGDSALTCIGIPAPAPLRLLERYVEEVRAYLSGRSVDCDGYPSSIHWLPRDLEAVPVDVACAGPRTIALAAHIADRVSFAVGAASERVEWALAHTRRALLAAGRDEREVSLGAYVVVAATDDLPSARDTIRGTVAVLTGFNAMRDARTDGQPEVLRRVAEPLRRAFAVEQAEARSRNDSEHMRFLASHVDDAYLDWFAVLGTPARVAARLRELVALGLRHLYLITGTPNTADPGLVERARSLLVHEVLPAVRA